MYQKLKNYYHLVVALLANIRFGFPSRGLTVIGVTGTDGKTTTTSLIYHILNNSGFNASMVSSVGAVINGKNYSVGFHVTNPSSWSLQKFIKLINKNGKKNVLVLEVTSHALDQYRNWGINFDIAVVTNVTREHLDYHKTYENYVKTKAKLLKMAKVGIVNRDDESYELFSKMNFNKLLTYGIEQKADYTLKTIKVKSVLPGKFNQYNMLAAAAAVSILGVDKDKINKAMATFQLPVGRLQEIYNNNFKYIVDFAHTPNSFLQLFSSLRPEVKGRIIHVFGSAGKRDASKRPEMGRISSLYNDLIILTAEDPRNEPIEKISSDIAAGIDHEFKLLDYRKYKDNNGFKKAYFKIGDRKQAIDFAVSIARKGDLVISTGKGHEESMNYGKGEEPWNELEVAGEAIKKYEKK